MANTIPLSLFIIIIIFYRNSYHWLNVRLRMNLNSLAHLPGVSNVPTSCTFHPDTVTPPHIQEMVFEDARMRYPVCLMDDNDGGGGDDSSNDSSGDQDDDEDEEPQSSIFSHHEVGQRRRGLFGGSFCQNSDYMRLWNRFNRMAYLPGLPTDCSFDLDTCELPDMIMSQDVNMHGAVYWARADDKGGGDTSSEEAKVEQTPAASPAAEEAPATEASPPAEEAPATEASPPAEEAPATEAPPPAEEAPPPYEEPAESHTPTNTDFDRYRDHDYFYPPTPMRSSCCESPKCFIIVWSLLLTLVI